MAGSPSIPKEEQIDAFLSYRIGDLVTHYCDGNWSDLSKGWTAGKAEIFEEANEGG